MKSVKLTNKNFEIAYDGSIEGRPTPIKFHNDLHDDVVLNTADIVEILSSIPSEGVANLNSITEKTAGEGVTIENVLIKDGVVGVSENITANATGVGTAIMDAAQQKYRILSTNVNHIVALPLLTDVPTGASYFGMLANTGCELRVHPTDQVAGITINGATGGNELKLNNVAGSTGSALFEAVRFKDTKWIVKTWSNVGLATAITPDK